MAKRLRLQLFNYVHVCQYNGEWKIPVTGFVKIVSKIDSFDGVELYDARKPIYSQGKGFSFGWDMISPIIITDELLIDLGFIACGKVIVNDFEYYRRFLNGDFEVHLCKSNYGGVIEDYIEYFTSRDDKMAVCEPQYIHTLQNAFVLATGNELFFKAKI